MNGFLDLCMEKPVAQQPRQSFNGAYSDFDEAYSSSYAHAEIMCANPYSGEVKPYVVEFYLTPGILSDFFKIEKHSVVRSVIHIFDNEQDKVAYEQHKPKIFN